MFGISFSEFLVIIILLVVVTDPKDIPGITRTILKYFYKAKNMLFQAKDEFRLKAVVEIFKQKLIKRQISPKALTLGEIKSALGGTAKQEIAIQQGIPKDKAKEIVKDIKDSGVKVQAQIQEDQIRVSSKKIDDLQAVMGALKEKDYGIHAQFLNYR